jgi:phage-related minor tail protein
MKTQNKKYITIEEQFKQVALNVSCVSDEDLSKTAEELLNETETEPFTIEERTDLNINKVTHDKVRRANK